MVVTKFDSKEDIEEIMKAYPDFKDVKVQLPYDITYNYSVTKDSYFVHRYYENKFVNKFYKEKLIYEEPKLLIDTLKSNDSLMVNSSSLDTKTLNFFNALDTTPLLKQTRFNIGKNNFRARIFNSVL